MDNDIEQNDNDSFNDGSLNNDDFDDNDQDVNHDPFPDECQNEVFGTESFYACLTNRYNVCPIFFSDSLQDTCQAAFNSTVINEHRPVLVYIHYDKSMYSNIFCSNIFCSEIIIDYLNNNYIVWPWDITFNSNKNSLKQAWINMFSTQSSDIFSIEQCPMLIGIMRGSEGKEDWASEYEFKILLKCDTITRTGEIPTLETLLRELIIFKEKCDENEQNLSFNFMTKTGLSWEIFLEIIKYLTLNDAVKAFSNKILPTLRKYQTRFHLSNPFRTFTSMILQTIKPEQIVSLRLDTTLFSIPSQLASLAVFTNVISLTLLRLQGVYYLDTYEEYFPKLVRLSLWYEKEINFNELAYILNALRRPIKRLEIHCEESVFTHSHTNRLDMRHTQNLTVEYLLIDTGHLSFPLTNECYKSCFLMTTIDFMKTMPNIRYVHLITNKYNLEELLEANEWTSLIKICYQLKTITIEALKSISRIEELSEKAIEIQDIFHNGRQIVKFQIAFM